MAVRNYVSVDGEILGHYDQGSSKSSVMYVRDGLGSVVTTVDVEGTVLNTYRYKPFGDWSRASGSAPDPRFLWVGTFGYRRSDSPRWSAYYVRARHYASADAAWTTRDPLWPSEMPYGYVNGMVPGSVDYWGLAPGGSSTTSRTAPGPPVNIQGEPNWILPGGNTTPTPGKGIPSSGGGPQPPRSTSPLIYDPTDTWDCCTSGLPLLFAGMWSLYRPQDIRAEFRWCVPASAPSAMPSPLYEDTPLPGSWWWELRCKEAKRNKDSICHEEVGKISCDLTRKQIRNLGKQGNNAGPIICNMWKTNMQRMCGCARARQSEIDLGCFKFGWLFNPEGKKPLGGPGDPVWIKLNNTHQTQATGFFAGCHKCIDNIRKYCPY